MGPLRSSSGEANRFRRARCHAKASMGPLRSSSGEGHDGVRPGLGPRAASMGPLRSSSGETAAPADSAARPEASMGPLRSSSGERRARGAASVARLGFNGAAAFKQRRVQVRARVADGPRRASMGPLRSSSGEFQPVPELPAVVVELQWGRCVQAAERQAARAMNMAIAELQWGRCVQAAERKLLARPSSGATMLQWGRCVQAAERTSWPWRVSVQHQRFNGAAAFKQRRAP